MGAKKKGGGIAGVIATIVLLYIAVTEIFPALKVSLGM